MTAGIHRSLLLPADPTRLRPARVYLRVTRTCNARCPYCPSWQMAKAFPAAELVARVLDEAAQVGAEEVRFTGGEPALYPGLFDAVARAHDLGMRTSVITNGTLLRTGKLRERALAAPLDHLVLSLDTPHAATHDRIRVIDGLFDTAVTGVAALRAARPNVAVEVNMVVSRETVSDIAAAVRLCAELGARALHLLPIKDCPELAMSRAQIDAHAERIPALVELARTLGVGLSPPTLELFGRSDAERDAAAAGRYPARSACYVPYKECFIDLITGLVWPCNSTPYTDRNASTCGSVFEEPFPAIWHGAKFAAIRRAYRLADPVPCSTKCDPSNDCHSTRYRAEVDRALAAAEGVAP